MSVKPIDYQITVPRAQEVAKITSEKQQSNVAAQQQSVDSVKNKAEADLRQVSKKEEVQETRIRQKNREEKDNKGSTKNKEKSKKQKESTYDKKKKGMLGSRIDIRI